MDLSLSWADLLGLASSLNSTPGYASLITGSECYLRLIAGLLFLIKPSSSSLDLWNGSIFFYTKLKHHLDISSAQSSSS